MKIILEIAVFGVEAAIEAMVAGADRIEFCENPLEGGTTPSYGSLKVLQPYLKNKPIYPIIRPRGGDFLYSENEYETIRQDLLMIKSLGYPGAVIGLLNADGSIDTLRTKELVQLAGDQMEITFHRAFDRAKDPLEALQNIIDTGCKRILTSGQVPNAQDAIELIASLQKAAAGKIIIMPGSGVRASNIRSIIDATHVTEMHSSARKMHDSKMQYQKTSMNEKLQSTLVDVQEIQAMQKAINA